VVQAQVKTPLPQVNKKFLVVAHIILDKAGDTLIDPLAIQQNLEFANQHFEPIGVSFEICEFNYVENYQYFRIDYEKQRENLNTAELENFRLNIFFVNDFADMDRCGVARLEGVKNGADIYMKNSCIGGGEYSLSHELGHYFGLVHTFAVGDELVDGSNCLTAGDKICDTPADPYDETQDPSLYVTDCMFDVKIKDANGDFYDPDVANIMSYYNCYCGNFTDDQYRLMASTYLNSSKVSW
jgi:hypothetical protein